MVKDLKIHSYKPPMFDGEAETSDIGSQSVVKTKCNPTLM